MMIVNTTDDNETILWRAGAQETLVFRSKVLFIVGDTDPWLEKNDSVHENILGAWRFLRR